MLQRILSKNKLSKNVKDNGNELNNLKLLYETEYLLGIFPEVVWFRVLDFLENQNDVKNLNNSSPFFRNLISRRCVLFLFKDVFQVILPYLVRESWNEVSHPGVRYISKRTSKSPVLNCRFVCHSWKTAIDELAEEFNVDKNWQISQPHGSTKLIFYNFKESYNFSSLDLPQKFVRKFQCCFENPFFGRTVTITTPPTRLPGDLQSEFYHEIFKLLENFGKHVRACNFHFSSDLSRHALEYVFVKVIELLDCLPNLKNLVISNQSSPYRIPTVLQKSPKIENLESLTLRFVSSSFANAFIEENLHVSELTVDVSYVNLARLFVNLKTLELFQCTWQEFKVLNTYDIPNWPLRTLKLKFGTGIDWCEMFEILSVRFSETLEELELGVTCEQIDRTTVNKIMEDSLKYRLSLHKIKKLHLAVSNYSTFDFLLGMANSLESLRISWKLETEELGEEESISELVNATRLQTVKILRYRSKLYQSNIWTLFPKLKTVTLDGWSIQSYSYNRREWFKRKNSGITGLFKRRFLLNLKQTK